jgi:hypothetical protein
MAAAVPTHVEAVHKAVGALDPQVVVVPAVRHGQREGALPLLQRAVEHHVGAGDGGERAAGGQHGSASAPPERSQRPREDTRRCG